MARITSRKSESRNGRSRRDFNGEFCKPFGIVLSAGALILNMADGERAWTLSLSGDETAQLVARLREAFPA